MQSGSDVRIASTAVIRNPDLATIGSRVAIDDFTVITTALELGSYIHIASHCSIIGGRGSRLVMEDFSGLAAGCRILCASDDFQGSALMNPMVPEEYRKLVYSTIRIGRFATLGTNVIVLPGVTIGEGAVVGAGSLVVGDLEPWGIFLGTPARKFSSRPREQVLALADEFVFRNKDLSRS